MAKPTKIAHPLKNRRGSSQGRRVIDSLRSDAVLIDGRSLVDMLQIISEYAKRVNHYKYRKDEVDGEYMEINDWTAFFEKSLPFQLARFSKISKDHIEQEFLEINEALQTRVMKDYLDTLLKYVLSEIIDPVAELYLTVTNAENSLSSTLSSIIKSTMVEAIKDYIALSNASAQYLCTTKQSFHVFLQAPWMIPAMDIYNYDIDIQKSKGGKREAILKAQEKLTTIFYQLLNGLQLIIESAPDYIEESLEPLQESLREKHQPHLGLLFTFLELFKHFQGDLNQLTQKHLDFFYQNVLQMQPKDAEPDQAHLVMEIANHLDQYPLPKGLLFKNGKDDNGEDIIFELDEEIIIDKTVISDLKTLYLNPGPEQYALEGEYIAPVANSADGQGEKFKKTEPQNWSSLGAKDSKLIDSNTQLPQEHPPARLGFVLSSPVLLLQEGKRTITITLKCEVLDREDGPDAATRATEIADCFTDFAVEKINTIIPKEILESDKLSASALAYLAQLLQIETPYVLKKPLKEFLQEKDEISCIDIFTAVDKECLEALLKGSNSEIVPMFNISFSGEEAWVLPKLKSVTENVKFKTPVSATGNKVDIVLEILLEPDDPAVTFYDEEVLQEKIDLKTPYPLVKIELNPDFEIKPHTDGNGGEPGEKACCLIKDKNGNSGSPSLYHFLRDVAILNASEIEVEVCGVKNLIVQNDENIQDVNSPILPFGTRPKVGDNFFVDAGANFYIGSREIFCKNWQQFWINAKWKDKPTSLTDHYEFYATPDYEDGTTTITDSSFKFGLSFLDKGQWIKHDEEKYATEPAAKRKKLYRLFDSYKENTNECLNGLLPLPADTFCYQVEEDFAPAYAYVPKSMPLEDIEPLTVNTRKGFARLTLAGVSFQHDRFTFVLTRQMSALAGLLDPKTIADANAIVLEIEDLGTNIKSKINNIFPQIGTITSELTSISSRVNTDSVNNNLDGILALVTNLQAELTSALANLGNPVQATADINQASGFANLIASRAAGINTDRGQIDSAILVILGLLNNEVDPGNFTMGSDGALQHVNRLIVVTAELKDKLKVDENVKNGIPNEPYTPTIKSLSIDYIAKADNKDIDLVHLYPYENTSRWEDIILNPTLLPTFHDEGSLYIGLENLSPGNNLHLLFQLAEATADSEADRADLDWYYLTGNSWLPLRSGFEVISDETDGLTVSGIVTIAVPNNISDIGNTIMPAGLFWIKVAAQKNVSGIAETIAVFAQAARVTAKISEANDTARLDSPLPEGSIAKLVEGDFSVKKIEQPFASFGGRTPEISGHFYTRVSEHLRHKGRGQMAFDYERIVLEEFPEIYKAKCISHTMGLSANEYARDLEVAPGFVVLTVIPDLTKLVAGNTLTPKAPVSLLEKIEKHLKDRISSFARIKVMNPRYELVNVRINVRLQKGRPENFYASKLKEDLTHFLAPWYLGDSEKIAFGQNVLFSDVVGFVENLDYIDFIQNLAMKGECDQVGDTIRPLTARSILTGGEICVTIDKPDCGPTAKPNPVTGHGSVIVTHQ